MAGIARETFSFLKALKKNNDREWFADNKSRYQDAQKDLTEFVGTLLPKLAKFDRSIAQVDPKKTTFRIYRDVRFSKNKEPYKTNLGAHIHAGSKTDMRAGYYLHLEPGKSMLAGGAHMPSADWLKAIRSEIDYNAEDLEKVLRSASFKKYFGKINGEQLKTSPRDYDKDHPKIDLLRYKSFTAVHEVKDSAMIDSAFDTYAARVFKALHPFDNFLNTALD